MDEYISWFNGHVANKPCANDYYSCSGEVLYVSDPFQHEMNNVIDNKPMCEECYKSAIGDI